MFGQDRHSPTLTNTATMTSSFDVATSAEIRDGGSVRVTIVRTGFTARGSDQSEQCPRLRNADRDDRGERADVTRNEQAARGRCAHSHRECALTRHFVGGNIAHVVGQDDRARQQSDHQRSPPRRARYPLDLHVRRTHGRHEAEEHQDHHLAQPEVAVGLRTTGVEHRGLSRPLLPTRAAARPPARPPSPQPPQPRTRRLRLA